jgi:hypothetical protein
MKTNKIVTQITFGLVLAGTWAATAHASTVFQAAAAQLGAAYDNTNLLPIGVPAVSVTNAPQTFTNLNPTVDYTYSIDGSTNTSAGFTPDFQWIGSGATTPGTGPIWTFGSQSKNYSLYEITDHPPLPDEGLEITLWGSNNGGSTWNLGTAAKVYEMGRSLAGVPDDGNTEWTFGVSVDMISPVAGLAQGTYSFSSGNPPDFEVDAIMQQRTPEPGSAVLLLVGAASLLAWRKWRKIASPTSYSKCS